MKTITNWKDLEPYGIEVLTGEACGLSYRLLCDVTAKGKAVLEKLWSVTQHLPPNWNRGSANDPHIGSIMLTPDLWLPLGIFALLESDCTEVWCVENRTLYGIEPTDTPEQIRDTRNLLNPAAVRSFAYRGTAGDRNRHVMTGRVQ